MEKLNAHAHKLFLCLMLLALLIAGCGPSASDSGQPTPEGNQDAASSSSTSSAGGGTVSDRSVAFVYKENPAEYNWSHLHELGRQYLVEQVPDIETKAVENISPEQAEQTLRDLATEGYKLIFATAPEYSAAVLAVAQDFPDTRFEVAKGTETADNVATYDGRMYQIFYVAGGYTGEMTVTGVIGFVAPEPTPEVVANINAITLSSRLTRICEPITVHVKWTGSWSDPEADRQAALELVEAGADVLVQNTYDPEVQKVAEEKGIRSMGYGFDMREFAPKANMSSIVWQWGWYYAQRVNALLEGEWEPQAYYGKVSTRNFGRGIVDLAPYTYDQIPQIMEAPPMKWRVSWNESKKDAFDGPLYTQAGDLVLARNEQFDLDYIRSGITWFVQGVVGEAPGTPPEPVEGLGAAISC